MNEIFTTNRFDDWILNLADEKAKATISLRIQRARAGNFGDAKPVGDGVSEMRIHYGPGYRVYYARNGKVTYLLICGGDKSTQQADIEAAKRIWSKVKESRNTE